MNSSKEILLVFCIAFSTGIQCASATGPTLKCVRDSYCSCEMSDDSGRYDLSPLSGRTPPYFDNIPGRNISEKFSYDPCVPFAVGKPGEKTACVNVAACQIDTSTEGRTGYINIAKHFTVEFVYDDVSQQVFLKYENEDLFHPVKTEVYFHCLKESEPTILQLEKASQTAVLFTLRSPHACLIRPKGLSFGSILCIIFSVLFIVYLVGGSLFLVFVQRKPLGEAVPPNKDFWLDLPDLVMDGAKFALNGFKTAQPPHRRLGRVEDDVDVDAFHDDDNDDNDDDQKAKASEGPPESSDGFSAVPV